MTRVRFHSRLVALLVVAATAASLGACEERGGVDRGAAHESAAPHTDHKNLEYMIGGRQIRLVDGVAETPAAPGSATRIVTRYFGNEARGDLNVDGREDVAFLLTQESGGSGTFFYAAAALDSPGGFVGSHAVWLGDRIAPQATEILPDGILVVHYADRAPGEGFAAQPSVGKSIWLKLDPATLQFGEVVQNFEGEADPDVMELGMKTWVWIRAADGGKEIVPRQAEDFTVRFEVGTFFATTDCNRVTGGYTTRGRELTFGEDMAATRMFCVDSQETIFTDLLQRTVSYTFTSHGELVLELTNGSGTMTFR